MASALPNAAACFSVRAPMAKMESSVVGGETRIVGKVSGQGALRIDGSIHGDVSVTGPVQIGPGASLEGDVQAERLEIAGTLRGDASCSDAIVVKVGAEVHGDLRGSSVAIEPGTQIDVQLDTQFELDFSSAGRRR